MAKEIIYDRRFIKINDDCFIPIIQHGSSNCWDYNWFTKRDIPEKNWFNISKIKQDDKWESKLYYNKKELEELADKWETYGNYKTRNTPFKPGEFKRWFLNGIRTAKTIEEYTSYGINILAHIDAYAGPEHKHIYENTHISSNSQIELSLQYLKEKLHNKGINPEGYDITITFEGRDCMKKLPKQKKNIQEPLDKYWVLENTEITIPYYLEKITSTRKWLTPDKKTAKKFKTMDEAAKYLEKHKKRFKHIEKWKTTYIPDDN